MTDALARLWWTVATIPNLTAYLYTAWTIYIVWLCAWVVLQKRDPVATLAWILILGAIPYIGFAIYFVLGPQRVKRQRLRRGKSKRGLDTYSDVCPANAECDELSKLGQSTTGLPPSTATNIDLLIDGAATFDAIVEAIGNARKHVHLEYYIYEPDQSGTRIRDALIERAKAGIEVKLLLDGVGSSRARHKFLRPLVEAGGQVAWFHPIKLRFFRRPWVNMRSHRKLVIIDGVIGFTGGVNVTDDENERVNAKAYRDLHVRVDGPVVRSMQLTFLEDWLYGAGCSIDVFEKSDLWGPEESTPGITAQMLVSGPDSTWEAIHRTHVGAIHEAGKRVWLVTPYFVPGEAALMALTSAAFGGLDVRVLVPKRSDSLFVTWAARSYYDELLQAGVRVYEYGPRMLHTKALIADDIVIVGSSNFDHRSFRLNFEASLMIRDAGVSARLGAFVEGELASAKEIPADRVLSFWRQKLPEAIARLFSPML